MGKKVKVDFTGVEAFSRVEEGRHHVKIVEVEQTQSQGGDDMLKIAYEVLSGESKGGRVYDNCMLVQKSLWRLKSLCKLIGMKCDGKVALDLDAMVGKTLDVQVFHEEYNGSLRAKVGDMLPHAASSADDDDLDDDFDDEDEDEEEEEETPKKKAPAKKAPAKKAPAKKAKPSKDEDEDEDEDDEDFDDDDDDEEEEEPKSKKKAPAKKAPAKKAPAKKGKKKPEPEEDEDDDEDDDWDEDDED